MMDGDVIFGDGMLFLAVFDVPLLDAHHFGESRATSAFFSGAL